MVKIMENPIFYMGWFGGFSHIFGSTPIGPWRKIDHLLAQRRVSGIQEATGTRGSAWVEGPSGTNLSSCDRVESKLNSHDISMGYKLNSVGLKKYPWNKDSVIKGGMSWPSPIERDGLDHGTSGSNLHGFGWQTLWNQFLTETLR